MFLTLIGKVYKETTYWLEEIEYLDAFVEETRIPLYFMLDFPTVEKYLEDLEPVLEDYEGQVFIFNDYPNRDYVYTEYIYQNKQFIKK